MSNIEPETSVEQNGYEEGRKKTGIRVSALPHHIQASARKIDVDCDGELGAEDVASVISDLGKKKKVNSLLRKTIAAFVVVSVLLIAGVFGASITAARLSQDIAVSNENGFAYVKGTDSEVMKTGNAINYERGVHVGLMSNEQLQLLREVILEEGSLRFVVKGHARDFNNDDVILIVEGGTITYNADGIIDARGDAKYILETVYGPQDGSRRLYVTCSLDSYGTYYGFEANEIVQNLF